MAATAVRPRPTSDGPAPARGRACRAAAYERVLHQLARRELRMLADLATWADPADAEHTTALTRHADLLGRVLLHHHAVERELLWPALLRALPEADRSAARTQVDRWTAKCARVDSDLRDVATAARQWSVAATPPARQAFATACRALADAVDGQTDDEENRLLPLLEAHLEPGDWTAIAESAHCRLTAREQLLVIGLALEDSCAAERARLIDGLSPAIRSAWRLYGGRRYRAAVVRLRGAPPAR